MTEQQVPEKGFWKHYKHDPEKAWNDHMYEVTNLSLDTDKDEQAYRVQYLPLYENREYLGIAEDCSRSSAGWFDMVDWKGDQVPRYTRITDPNLIGRLTDKRGELYGF